MNRLPSAVLLLALSLGAARASAQTPEPPPLPADAGHTPVLTKPPSLAHAVEPVFPEQAKHEHVSGDVTLQVDIGADGHVTHAEVTTPAGHGFDEAALDAVKQFVFTPAEIDGQPAPVRIAYTQHFFYTPATPPDAGAAPDAAPLPPIAIKGRVLERATRVPVAGAAVQVLPDGEPVVTDSAGHFELRAAPGGRAISVRSGQHQPFETHELIKTGEQLEVTYYVMPRTYGLYETVVRGDREKKEVTRHTLQREELESVPGSLGDPVRVVQDLPGVARAPFLSGALIVRGAAPADTGTYIDGVPVPYLFHLGDGPSLINPEFIDRMDFYPGGFGAEYGRAIGGVLDVQTRAPRSDAVHGSFTSSALNTGGFISVPISEGLTLSAAVRRSTIDLFLRLALPKDSNATYAIPSYGDFQLRLDYHPTGSHHTFKLFSYGASDAIEVVSNGGHDGKFDFNESLGLVAISLGWTYQNGPLKLTTAPYIAFDRSDTGGGLLHTIEHDHAEGVREKLELSLGELATVRAGLDLFDVNGKSVGQIPADPVDYREFPGGSPSRPSRPFEIHIGYLDLGEWAELELNLGRLKLIPGVRADQYKYGSKYHTSIDPRITARLALLGETSRPTTVLKGAFGVMHNTGDFPLLVTTYGNPDLELQRALQTSFGVEQRLTDSLHIDVTGFYNRRTNLGEPTDDLVTQADGTLVRENYDNGARGRSYGLEVMLRQEITRHFFGWLSYTLAWSDQRNADDKAFHPADFDQRHLLTIVGQYRFGNGWSLGGRFRLTSGNPRTPVVDSVLDSDAQVYSPINGAIGSAREKTFHQLDLRVDKEFLHDTWSWGIYLDVQNVYNAKNVEFTQSDYRYRTTREIPGIPIFPTIGVKGAF